MTFANVTRKSDELTKSLKRAAMQTAAAQMAASVAAMAIEMAAVSAAGYATAAAAIAAGSCIPIIGWAAAAVIAAGTWIGGDIAKRKVKEMMADAKQKIQEMGDATTAEVEAVQSRIADAEMPAAEQLAVSGQPLEGLGAFLGVTKKNITGAVAKAQTKSVGVVGQAILRTGRTGAQLVGDKKGEAYVRKKEEDWDRNTKRVEKMFAEKLQNPYKMIAHDLDTIGRTVSGQQIVHVMKAKIDELLKAARRDFDLYKAGSIAQAETPEYRELVRVNLAKGLRGDPDFASKAAEINARQKMIAAEFSPTALAASVPSAPASGASLLGTAAAAVGAFMFFRP